MAKKPRVYSKKKGIEPDPPASTGRPPIPIDLDEAFRLGTIGCTIDECAIAFDCSVAHLTSSPEFLEAHKKGLLNVKKSLRRQQIEMAAEGNATMAIWLGKQLLGQRDKQDMHIDQPQTINVLIGGNDYKGENEAE